MKKWKIINKYVEQKSGSNFDNLIRILLENRGITDKKDIKEFLNPKLEDITIENVGIDRKQLDKALARIFEAIKKDEQIIVYGDYDVDGITGTAILWETINEAGGKVHPFIPDRIEEGYGLSIAGISKIKDPSSAKATAGKQKSNYNEVKLIITVDNGIVANEAVDFANKEGIDVIITDHHTIGEKLPDALAIVHTTKLCGAGVAYLLAQELRKSPQLPLIPLRSGFAGQVKGENVWEDNHLELAALGTIADMVPLTGANRKIVKFGLEKLCKTQRPGLHELFKNAGCENNVLGVYEVGFIISPRLNASGRIENAMDSLRLLCTKDKSKAKYLAEKLEIINRERQMLMKQATEHAILSIKNQVSSIKKILIVGHEEYNQGVIGLVAGKLVEEFYRPSIVISKGEKHSKASVRSVEGFNIIEFLRTQSEFFVNVGGHPMAAGFTIETEKLEIFKETLETAVEELIDGETLTKKLKIDCELPFSVINKEFYEYLQQLAPFGMKNPEPVFATKDITIKDLRIIGRDGKHLKLLLEFPHFAEATRGRPISYQEFEAIAFGMGELGREIKVGDKIDVAYVIDENRWNGNTKLQLKVKDIHPNRLS